MFRGLISNKHKKSVTITQIKQRALIVMYDRENAQTARPWSGFLRLTSEQPIKLSIKEYIQ